MESAKWSVAAGIMAGGGKVGGCDLTLVGG